MVGCDNTEVNFVIFASWITNPLITLASLLLFTHSVLLNGSTMGVLVLQNLPKANGIAHSATSV